MLNHVSIMGRIVADIDLKQTPSGVDFCKFRIACDRDFTDKATGNKECDFLDVTAWRHTAKFIGNHLGKGRMIVISGRIQTHKYTDKDGNNRTATEIQAENVYFADSKRPDNSAQAAPVATDFASMSDDDADIPF